MQRFDRRGTVVGELHQVVGQARPVAKLLARGGFFAANGPTSRRNSIQHQESGVIFTENRETGGEDRHGLPLDALSRLPLPCVNEVRPAGRPYSYLTPNLL